jgi:hypothetical protein
LGLEFLDDLVGIYNSSNFFELSKRFLVVIELLPLIVFVVLVAGSEDSIGLGIICAPLPLEYVFRALGCILVYLILLLGYILSSHFLDSHSSLLETL